MKPKEHLWSSEMVSLIEAAGIKISSRVSLAFLNRLLHRDKDNSLKLKTISEMCDRHGNEILDYQKQHARNVLSEHHFDPDTGTPLCEAGTGLLHGFAPAGQLSPDFKSKIDSFVGSYNSSKKDGINIQMTEKQSSDIEDPDMPAIYIAMDGVCAKRQKDKRNKQEPPTVPAEDVCTEEDLSAAPKQKGRPSVETAVGHINIGEKRYVLVAEDMMQLCRHILAFLMEFGLLDGRRLVFMTDGAKDIKAALETVFSICHYTVILDWFHLRKHCSETISMMLRAGKENRDTQYRIKRTIFRYLWCGNVQGVIAYILNLPSADVRSESRRKELIDYLRRKEYAIPCYAVRRHLKLKISSNPVEKANDLSVARRQKKKGMSWSRHGSRGLAALTAMYMNNEDERWHRNHILSYEMYEKYGDALAA